MGFFFFNWKIIKKPSAAHDQTAIFAPVLWRLEPLTNQLGYFCQHQHFSRYQQHLQSSSLKIGCSVGKQQVSFFSQATGLCSTTAFLLTSCRLGYLCPQLLLPVMGLWNHLGMAQLGGGGEKTGRLLWAESEAQCMAAFRTWAHPSLPDDWAAPKHLAFMMKCGEGENDFFLLFSETMATCIPNISLSPTSVETLAFLIKSLTNLNLSLLSKEQHKEVFFHNFWMVGNFKCHYGNIFS